MATKKKVKEPAKTKVEMNAEQARKILDKEYKNEQRVALKIEAVLKEEGYKLKVQSRIVLVPIR